MIWLNNDRQDVHAKPGLEGVIAYCFTCLSCSFNVEYDLGFDDWDKRHFLEDTENEMRRLVKMENELECLRPYKSYESRPSSLRW